MIIRYGRHGLLKLPSFGEITDRWTSAHRLLMNLDPTDFDTTKTETAAVRAARKDTSDARMWGQGVVIEYSAPAEANGKLSIAVLVAKHTTCLSLVLLCHAMAHRSFIGLRIYCR